MQVSYLLLPFQILLVVVLQKAYGLDCYQCNSHVEQACAGDVMKFQKEYLKPCPSNATSCRKIQQKIFYNEDNHDRTIRQCSFVQDPPLRCIDRTGTYKFKTSYCHCLDEGCNSGNSVILSLSVLSVSLGLVHIFTKWL